MPIGYRFDARRSARRAKALISRASTRDSQKRPVFHDLWCSTAPGISPFAGREGVACRGDHGLGIAKVQLSAAIAPDDLVPPEDRHPGTEGMQHLGPSRMNGAP